MWQPYEADLGHLPAFCVARKDTVDGKGATYVFLHSRDTPPRPCPSTIWVGTGTAWHVVYDDRLHRIDLHVKVEKNWREEHGLYILTWDMRQQRLCHAPPQTGEMPYDHDYYHWYRPVTRKYVDRNNAKLDMMVMCSN